MKKKLLAVALVAAMAASLMACGGGSSSSSSAPAEGQATEATETAAAAGGAGIRLLNGKPEIDTQLKALAAKYKEETGNDVSIETIGGDTNASDELKKMYQADNMPDIFVIEANQAPNWDGLLADLTGEAWTNDTDYELVDAKMDRSGIQR